MMWCVWGQTPRQAHKQQRSATQLREPHLPGMLHQGVPEGPAMPQTLQHDVEEAIVLPGQVAQPWRQAVVIGAGLMLNHLAARFCNCVCSVLLLLQAGLPPARNNILAMLNSSCTQSSHPEHASSGGAERQPTE